MTKNGPKRFVSEKIRNSWLPDSLQTLRENKSRSNVVGVLKNYDIRNYIQRIGCIRRIWTPRWRPFNVAFAAVIFRMLNYYRHVKYL